MESAEISHNSYNGEGYMLHVTSFFFIHSKNKGILNTVKLFYEVLLSLAYGNIYLWRLESQGTIKYFLKLLRCCISCKLIKLFGLLSTCSTLSSLVQS